MKFFMFNWTLTFSLSLFWLSMYVPSISHKPLDTDILSTVVLDQYVHDSNSSKPLDADILATVILAQYVRYSELSRAIGF